MHTKTYFRQHLIIECQPPTILMDVDSLKGSSFNGRDEFKGNLNGTNIKNNYKEIYYMDGKHEAQQRFNFDDPQQINLNGRPVGLRRQPTKYPHGLGVCVQTVNDEEQYNHQQQQQQLQLQQVTNYSRASTLRSSWDGTKQQHQHPQEMKCQSHDNQQQQHHHQQSQRKYHIGMLSSPENLAELQVRRYKYPLTGNYYLDRSFLVI